jgi:hypothetical protein
VPGAGWPGDHPRLRRRSCVGRPQRSRPRQRSDRPRIAGLQRLPRILRALRCPWPAMARVPRARPRTRRDSARNDDAAEAMRAHLQATLRNIADKGLDRLFVFRFEGGHLLPAQVPSVAAREGAGPRHVAFHSSGRWMYCVNELDSTVCAYRSIRCGGRNACADAVLVLAPRHLHRQKPRGRGPGEDASGRPCRSIPCIQRREGRKRTTVHLTQEL